MPLTETPLYDLACRPALGPAYRHLIRSLQAHGLLLPPSHHPTDIEEPQSAVGQGPDQVADRRPAGHDALVVCGLVFRMKLRGVDYAELSEEEKAAQRAAEAKAV